MKQRDYNKIRALVWEERKSGNMDSLIELRDFLNEQINLGKPDMEEIIQTSSEEERPDILSLELEEFLTVPTYGIKFFRNDLVKAIKKIKRLKRTVLVVDSIGIGKNILLQEKGVGARTVGKYEHALNKYGYSLNRPLSEEQKERFKVYQKKHTIV
ncbi:MAG: hypothetical protein HFH08_05545 [Bacilli bacterium]|nr:hypothetical protein [Bacilli bacterium]